MVLKQQNRRIVLAAPAFAQGHLAQAVRRNIHIYIIVLYQRLDLAVV